ncbi:MAG: tyrosine-type recombinase/integrase [Chromatiales bacterium]|nr:site-specific integrase [Gammaproteobacteria bacterium]
MATIARIKTSNGFKYKAILRKKGRLLKTKTFTRKADARTWAKRLEADFEAMDALGAKGAGKTFYELADEYMAQWSGKSKEQGARVQMWVNHFEKRKLIDITADDIRDYLNDYAAGKAHRWDGIDKTGKSKTKATKRTRAPATVNRARAALSAVFKFAVQQGYVSHNPVRRVPSRTERNQRVRWLDESERKALLTACRASEWDKLYLLVLMALTTGARQGELLKLRWSDIDFNAKTATARDTKNGDDRILTLPTPTVDELKKYRQIGDGLVFPSQKRPQRPFEFRKHWNAALATAGVEDFRFHDLRHSAASYLVMAGATLYEAAEVLGHRSVETTKRYAHLSTEHKAKLTERILGGMMGQGND